MVEATFAARLDLRRGEAQPSLDFRARHLPLLLAANRAHRVRVAHGRQRRPAPAWGGCSIMVECAAERRDQSAQFVLVCKGHGALKILPTLVPIAGMRAVSVRSGCGGVRGVGSESHADLRPSRAHARVVAVGHVVLGPRP